MKLIFYWVVFSALALMGATNTAIRFAENIHKYGPVAAKKLKPTYPFLIPALALSLIVFGISQIAAHAGAGQSGGDPLTGLPGIDFLGIGIF